ncbi:MAG: PAS domain S-box protein [Nitrincola sp.]|nr:PAS domain S-box protein [Nitrincola sp.]
MLGKFFSSESKQALDQSIIAVVTIDEINQITFFNKAAESLWGYSAGEVLGKNVALLLPDEIQSNHGNIRQSASTN